MRASFFITLFLASAFTELSADQPKLCSAKPLPIGKNVKVMTWNIQFALGKYVPFWRGTVEDMPSLAVVKATLRDMKRVIREQDPDIIFLQEASRHSVISHYIDQVAGIAEELGEDFCQKSQYYWNSIFVPATNMMGAMDYSLVIFSRYAIENINVTSLPENWSLPRAWFSPKRILFETNLLVEDMSKVSLLNTHLEAHDKFGTLRMSQAHTVANRLRELHQEKTPFILAGDFNLIPPGIWESLPENQQENFSPSMNMDLFYKQSNARVIPSLEQIKDSGVQSWTTAYDENLYQLDLVLDYLIYSEPFELVESDVLQKHYNLSDHVPVTATFYIKDRKLKP